MIDPDGRLGHIAIGAIVGAVVNVGVGLFTGQIKDVGDFFAYAAIGAGAGALAAATGGAALKLVGGASGFASGAFSGAIGGFTDGFTTGLGNGAYRLLRYGEGSIKDVVGEALSGAAIGGFSGAVFGGILGHIFRPKGNLDLPSGKVGTAGEVVDEFGNKISVGEIMSYGTDEDWTAVFRNGKWEYVQTPPSSKIVLLTDEKFSQALFKETIKATEKINGYLIHGTKGLIGDTFNRNIFYIETPFC
jgi:hypothetical protein